MVYPQNRLPKALTDQEKSHGMGPWLFSSDRVPISIGFGLKFCPVSSVAN
jgi:hypothetical protein